jgi:hypothetical protein
MRLPIDLSFADDVELPHDVDLELEAVLLATTASDAPHAEDAFLADFTRWLVARGADAAQRSLGLELARDALDCVGDADGTWQALPIERWLTARVDRCAGTTAERAELARELVSWLVADGRLSLHGQRMLVRRIDGVRVEDSPAGLRAPTTGPRLAA